MMFEDETEKYSKYKEKDLVEESAWLILKSIDFNDGVNILLIL